MTKSFLLCVSLICLALGCDQDPSLAEMDRQGQLWRIWSQAINYSPSNDSESICVLLHEYPNDLREGNYRLPNARVDFSIGELNIGEYSIQFDRGIGREGGLLSLVDAFARHKNAESCLLSLDQLITGVLDDHAYVEDSESLLYMISARMLVLAHLNEIDGVDRTSLQLKLDWTSEHLKRVANGEGIQEPIP